MKIEIRTPFDKENEKTPFPSILAALEEERVFNIARTKGGDFEIEEMCDEYFRIALTKDQLVGLAEEIKAFAMSEQFCGNCGHPADNLKTYEGPSKHWIEDQGKGLCEECTERAIASKKWA